MNAVTLVRRQLETSYAVTLPLLEDLRDSPLAAPTASGGNHAWWILGHLTQSEGHLLCDWMRGQPNPVAELAPLFAGGTTPCAEGQGYPPFDDLLEKFQQMRAGVLEHLAKLGDADLDTPCVNCPEQFAAFFGTVGLCLSNTALHWMNHRGQLADIRRSLGREPIMA